MNAEVTEKNGSRRKRGDVSKKSRECINEVRVGLRWTSTMTGDTGLGDVTKPRGVASFTWEKLLSCCHVSVRHKKSYLWSFMMSWRRCPLPKSEWMLNSQKRSSLMRILFIPICSQTLGEVLALPENEQKHFNLALAKSRLNP